ncbi:MAG: hypothetical protein JNJ48_05735 [Phycisphaerae bacterium]|nr:hypothetical protein [Phycisphaerae bacterium]
MSTIGTSVAQAIAGSDPAKAASSKEPARRAKDAERRDLKRGDVVEIVVPSPDAVEAGRSADTSTDKRRQPDPRGARPPAKSPKKPDRPSLDVQG